MSATNWTELRLNTVSWEPGPDCSMERSLYNFPVDHRLGILNGRITSVLITVEGAGPDKDGEYTADIEDINEDTYSLTLAFT